MKSYSIEDSSNIFWVYKDQPPDVVQTNYYNKDGNLDSTSLHLAYPDSTVFTIYGYTGNKSSGCKKYDQNRQLLSIGMISWHSEKQYNVKEYNTTGKLLNETNYTLDTNYRHKITAYKAFDSTGKLTRDVVQIFDLADSEEIAGYKMEDRIKGSTTYTRYKYDKEKDIKGNPLKVCLLKEKRFLNSFGILEVFEYRYY